MRFLEQVRRATWVIPALTVAAAVLWPLGARWQHARRQVERVDWARHLAEHGVSPRPPCSQPELLLRLARLEPQLASWENIGGCGAGGGSSSSAVGGVKWVGRSVRGGLLDAQCMISHTRLDDATQSVVNTRVAAGITDKWHVGVNVPFLYKTQKVEAVDQERRTASITGLGDLSLEVTRNFGISNNTSATLSMVFPTGADDAVRQGVILPQQSQLGAGQLGAAATVEHTIDRLWGLAILGASLSYNGAENTIRDSPEGDYRAPGAAAFGHLGYIMGPWVASGGLTLSANFGHNRERGQKVDAPLYTAGLSMGLEWSSDYLAVIMGGVLPFSTGGPESWTLALGLATSLF